MTGEDSVLAAISRDVVLGWPEIWDDIVARGRALFVADQVRDPHTTVLKCVRAKTPY